MKKLRSGAKVNDFSPFQNLKCRATALTDTGRRAIEIVEVLRNYGLELMAEAGIEMPH